MAVTEDSDDDIPLFGPDPRLPFPRLPDPASGGDDATAPVVMMVPLTIVAPVVDEMVAESDDEENVYAHIDARAIDVTLDMPSANPNSMNVTSHRQDKYANLSC
jgi:hypothetical protein